MKSPQFGLHAAIEEHHWWFLGRRRIVTELVHRLVPLSRQNLIVDIGCGTGANIEAFAEEYSCVGVDPSPEAIALARRRFPNARFICGAIPDAPGEVEGEANLFLLMDVIEHVPDDFWLLSTILARAKPGALVLITVPADMRLWSEHDVSFGHYRRYDLSRLARVWAGLPVTVPLMSYYNTRLYPIVRGVRAINRLRGRASGTAGTDFQTPPKPLNLLLQSIFAGEANVLAGLLEGTRIRGFSYGVSLIAVLRREPGTFEPRRKPLETPPDPHNPSISL